MTTIRAGFRQPGTVIVWLALVALVVALAVLVPGQTAVLLMAPPLLGLVAWFRVRAVRLEITESVVQARQGWYLPAMQVPRSRIRAIHYYPFVISFTGPERKPVMRTRADWTLSQMKAAAGELKVPLYDHRVSLGLREVRIGRLVYDPASPSQLS